MHISPKYAQASLYSKLLSSGYFDEAWYRLAYKEEIEFPDDLLLDYVKAGIQNGRDPSPYFNTILYQRAHPVSAEKALVHYLRSRRAADSGAYCDEQALLNAQEAFRERTATSLNKDNRASLKPFAVYLQCGAGSLWREWHPAEDQPWHLLINHYDPTYIGEIPAEVEFQQAGIYPGTKFTSFSSILEKYPFVLEPYEYILLLDDDVSFAEGDITRLFSIIQKYGWDMAQASLSAGSSCSFPVFFNPGKGGYRQVNGVELMMPVYSTRILGSIRQLIGQSISGWGYDAALSMTAARDGFRAAVVDEVVAHHDRSINADTGKYYQMLHQAQIYPEIEFTHLQKKYGFTKPLFYKLAPSSVGKEIQL